MAGGGDLDSSCYTNGSKIHISGRLDYKNLDTYLHFPQMWDSGLPLGQMSLEEWFDLNIYFVLTNLDENEFWILGKIDVQLPDLSFEYEYPLPDLDDGNYIVYIFPGGYWFNEFDNATFPLHYDYWPGEYLGGEKLEFSIPCPVEVNQFPVVNANGPYEGSARAPIKLNSTSTYDPDGDDASLIFEWYAPGYSIGIQGPQPEVVFDEPGSYMISLKVEDSEGAISYPGAGNPYNFALVTVTDLPLNREPVALCQDALVFAGEGGVADAFIDGGSYDPDGDPITLEQTPTGPYSLGISDGTLIVTDDKGLSSTCTATVTVEDKTPPTISSLTVSPDTLWPPNHKMVPISLTVTATDNCEDSIEIKLLSITMNEGEETNTYDPTYDDTQGDGNTTDDIQVDAAGNIFLRAERSGKNDGRVYTLTYEAKDSSGNTATATATVTVPHDMK